LLHLVGYLFYIKTIVSRLIKISELQANVDKLGQLTEELFGLNSETSILCQHRHQSHNKFIEWPLTATEIKRCGNKTNYGNHKSVAKRIFCSHFLHTFWKNICP
jgi:hypothetical protein